MFTGLVFAAFSTHTEPTQEMRQLIFGMFV